MLTIFIIFKMQRNQIYQNNQATNQMKMFNMHQEYTSQCFNTWQSFYFIPSSPYFYFGFEENFTPVYLFVVNQPKNQQENMQQSSILYSGEAQLANQEQKIQKNFEIKAKQTPSRLNKRRKVIQLQNINDNQGNRNILSNSLKLALKNIRNSITQQNCYFKKITDYKKLNYNIDQFMKKLNQLLPSDINYIRPRMIKQIFEGQQKQFAIILKILIRKFFKQQIYKSYGKETQMKKLIRAHHIKAGRKLLYYFCQPSQKNQSANQL